MELLSLIVGLPFAPVRGVVALAEVLREEVERELHDPSRLRRQLEDIEHAMASGELSEDEGAQAQQEILQRMVGYPAPIDSAATGPGTGEEEGVIQ